MVGGGGEGGGLSKIYKGGDVALRSFACLEGSHT